MKTVIVNVNLEYCFDVLTDADAIFQVEDVELPSEYVEDSFKISKVLNGNQTKSGRVMEDL